MSDQHAESVTPDHCLYCGGAGNGTGAPCGFCVEGRPLDTQEDWDRSWGKVFAQIEANRADPSRTVKRSDRRHSDGDDRG